LVEELRLDPKLLEGKTYDLEIVKREDVRSARSGGAWFTVPKDLDDALDDSSFNESFRDRLKRWLEEEDGFGIDTDEDDSDTDSTSYELVT
jgi:hypothetical protein